MMKIATIGFFALFALATVGCDKKPADGTTNDLRNPTLVGKGGIPDDSVKPVARGGIPDDSIKPVLTPKAGVPDDSVKPVPPGGVKPLNARTGTADDGVRTVSPGTTPVKPTPTPVPTPR